jgi:hypothetical protein
VTQAVFGRSRRRRWPWFGARSPLDKFMDLAPDIDVLLVGLEAAQ